MKKKILITGAAQNLGEYLVKRLVKEEYEIILHYNKSKDKAEKLAKKYRDLGFSLEIIQADFSSNNSLYEFLNTLKSSAKNLYGFIHNVGNFQIGSFLNTSLLSWEELIQVNLTASFILLKELIPLLYPQKGHVICMGFAGINTNKADNYCSIYSLTKQALLFMVKSLAKEVALNHVKINMISPGYLEKSIVMPKDPLPMKRTATFEEIFQTVMFLLNQTYITGQNIEVAGGIRL